MAILKSLNDWSEAPALGGGAKLADFCFLCHKPLSFPAVYWLGGSLDNPPSDGAEYGCTHNAPRVSQRA